MKKQRNDEAEYNKETNGGVAIATVLIATNVIINKTKVYVIIKEAKVEVIIRETKVYVIIKETKDVSLATS